MQIFTTKRKDINNRLDCYYYQPEFIEIENKLKRLKLKKIKDISTNLKNGSTPRGGVFQKSGIPYFRSQDFSLFDFEIRQFITPEFHEKLFRSAIKANDVLVAVVGATLGVIGYVPQHIHKGNINQNVARIRVKDTDINPKYLAVFLASKIGQKLIFRNATITAQSYLNNQQLGDIEIPILDRQTQNRIADIMQNAYLAKEEKLKQANELLNSLDDYALDKLGVDTKTLGISLSSSRGIYTNSQGYTILSVRSEDLENNWDVRIYTAKYKKNINFLLKSKYKLVTLKEIVADREEVHRGVTPKYTKDGIPVIKTANLQSNEISPLEKAYVSQSFFSNNPRGQIKNNDILISSTGMGSIGKIALFNSNEKALADNHISIIRVNTSLIKPLFLALFLRTERGLLQIERQITGSTGQTELYPSNIEKVQIPLPSLDIQEKICQEVKKRQQRARTLKKEAFKVLKNAKKKVEEMILN